MVLELIFGSTLALRTNYSEIDMSAIGQTVLDMVKALFTILTAVNTRETGFKTLKRDMVFSLLKMELNMRGLLKRIE